MAAMLCGVQLTKALIVLFTLRLVAAATPQKAENGDMSLAVNQPTVAAATPQKAENGDMSLAVTPEQAMVNATPQEAGGLSFQAGADGTIQARTGTFKKIEGGSLMRRADTPASLEHVDQVTKKAKEEPRRYQSKEAGKLNIFVLTVPRNHDRVEKLLRSTATLGYVRSNNITQINGTDFKQYGFSAGLTEKSAKDKNKGMLDMISDLAAKSPPAATFPTGFANTAMKKLTPSQLAIYLGHRAFWAKAAKMPSNSWSILVEDDAHILAGPKQLRNFLAQAEQAAVPLTGSPAHLVYLKKCIRGRDFMKSYMRDSLGYALRSNTAKDLLKHAPGDVPVAAAIKNFTEGGLCAPLLETNDLPEDSDEPMKQPQSMPEHQVGQSHKEAPHQGKESEDPLNGQPLHSFVLTVPRNHHRMSSFMENAEKMGYVGVDSVSKVDGLDFETFYDAKSKSGLSERRGATIREAAMAKMIIAFTNQSTSSSAPIPADFAREAPHSLSPAQLATYLGHRRFWMEAAELPTNAWAVLFEDDAQLMGGPTQLRGFLGQADKASMQLQGSPARLMYLKFCAKGRAFMQFYMRDAMGYALRPSTARELLKHASGETPVNSAIKKYTEGGLCAPLLKADKADEHVSSTSSASKNHAQFDKESSPTDEERKDDKLTDEELKAYEHLRAKDLLKAGEPPLEAHNKSTTAE